MFTTVQTLKVIEFDKAKFIEFLAQFGYTLNEIAYTTTTYKKCPTTDLLVHILNFDNAKYREFVEAMDELTMCEDASWHCYLSADTELSMIISLSGVMVGKNQVLGLVNF